MLIFFVLAISTLFTVYLLHKEDLIRLKFRALRTKRKEIISLGKEITNDLMHDNRCSADGKLLHYRNRIREYKAILYDCEKCFEGPGYSRIRKKLAIMERNDATRIKLQKNRWSYIIATAAYPQ